MDYYSTATESNRDSTNTNLTLTQQQQQPHHPQGLSPWQTLSAFQTPYPWRARDRQSVIQPLLNQQQQQQQQQQQEQEQEQEQQLAPGSATQMQQQQQEAQFGRGAGTQFELDVTDPGIPSTLRPTADAGNPIASGMQRNSVTMKDVQPGTEEAVPLESDPGRAEEQAGEGYDGTQPNE